MNALQLIQEYKETKNHQLLKDNWLKYLVITKQQSIDLQRVESLSQIEKNPVVNYVEKTLEVLEKLSISQKDKGIIQEVLIWSEVAKCGSNSQRKKWNNQGFNLFVHNEGSAYIYLNDFDRDDEDKEELIFTLIKTHGLLGQYIKGEVKLNANKPLSDLLNLSLVIDGEKLTFERLKNILYYLNQCIMRGVSLKLWEKYNEHIESLINYILRGNVYDNDSLKNRIKKLRSTSIKNGERFSEVYEDVMSNNPLVERELNVLFNNVEALWYVDSGLEDFSLEEFFKIFLIINSKFNHRTKHIHFQQLMEQVYYDYKGKKKINLYKKRIFEKLLSDITFEDILSNNILDNPHVSANVTQSNNTLFFSFSFSKASQKLIEFCVEAEKEGALFEQAIILLYDLFDLRRDQFDRFNNEETYLSSMNNNIQDKLVILDYIVGDKVVDIGPGGGALLDHITNKHPDKEAIGIDFSKNVVETLEKRIQNEELLWNIKYGNALELEDYLDEKVDTIIYCSIIHELFSYIETDGSKFNYKTIEKALKSGFKMLNQNGRIIIRDGIMSDNDKRIIRFRSSDDIKTLKQYVKDFKGRNIEYKIIGQNEVLMNANDCMEFLYTYTWGEESYPHEVQEQFGYFQPKEYKKFIQETLGDKAEVKVCEAFLQEGYSIALSPKIELFDEDYQNVSLPNSTCLIVIEKK